LPYHCLIDLVDFSFGIKARTEFDAVNAIATLNIISPTDTSVFAPLIHSFPMPPAGCKMGSATGRTTVLPANVAAGARGTDARDYDSQNCRARAIDDG
jgi:hypothetical protein